MEKLCDLDDLNATGAYGAQIHGKEYVVVRAPGDQPYVYRNSCPHLNIALDMRENEFLDPGHEFIVCANHGALFQIHDGLCVAGPCKSAALTAVPYTVAQDAVWLSSPFSKE